VREFAVVRVIDAETALQVERTCAECGGSGLWVVARDASGRLEFVQPGGDDPPDRLAAPPRRIDDYYARPMVRSTALVRPRSGRVIAGGCAALARRFDVSPWRVRFLFIVSLLLPGPQFLLYIALWIIVPSE
jgi:phage shock protein PspC (stress-responsive transcriptional regulator)